MRLKQQLFFILVFFILSLSVSAQRSDQDSTKTTKEKSVVERKHSPTKATIYSTLVPGLGQVYNRKNWYWKVPIIYGLGGLFVHNIRKSNANYTLFRDALFARQDTLESTVDTEFLSLSDSDVKTRKDFYKKQRDTNILYLLLLYSVNIIDATVEAHLLHFNVGEKYIMSFQPNLIPSQSASVSNTIGLSLTFKFQ